MDRRGLLEVGAVAVASGLATAGLLGASTAVQWGLVLGVVAGAGIAAAANYQARTRHETRVSADRFDEVDAVGADPMDRGASEDAARGEGPGERPGPHERGDGSPDGGRRAGEVPGDERLDGGVPEVERLGSGVRDAERLEREATGTVERPPPER